MASAAERLRRWVSGSYPGGGCWQRSKAVIHSVRQGVWCSGIGVSEVRGRRNQGDGCAGDAMPCALGQSRAARGWLMGVGAGGLVGPLRCNNVVRLDGDPVPATTGVVNAGSGVGRNDSPRDCSMGGCGGSWRRPLTPGWRCAFATTHGWMWGELATGVGPGPRRFAGRGEVGTPHGPELGRLVDTDRRGGR